MTAAALIAIAFSGVLLILLGTRDPKRLRNARRAGRANAVVTPLPTAMRHIFGWLSLAPGVALGILGEWWAFLIWLGAITAIGWTIAIAWRPGQAPRDRFPSHRNQVQQSQKL